MASMTNRLAFSFATYAKAIASVVYDDPERSPFVVGITGPWGSGKTTLMDAVIHELGDEQFITVRFNAWAHSKQDAIWRALFTNIVAALREDSYRRYPEQSDGRRAAEADEFEADLDEAERALYAAFTREVPGEMQLDTGQLAKTGAKLALRFVPWGDVGSALAGWFFDKATQPGRKSDDATAAGLKEQDVEQLWGIFKRDIVRQHIARIESIEQFHSAIERILRRALDNDARRLVVSVDDVDRCLPEQGLEVLEAIKLYLDLPGSVFLVAMDQDVLQHALDLRYQQGATTPRRITSELYAEKMIDLTFAIPSYDETEFSTFVSGLPLSNVLGAHFELISAVLPRNPRTWERFANRTSLYRSIFDGIAEQRNLQPLWQEEGLDNYFVKLQLLNFRWPAVTRSLGSLADLVLLEQSVQEAANNVGPTLLQAGEPFEERLRGNSASARELPEGVWAHLTDASLLRFLHSEPHFSEVMQHANGGQTSILQKMYAVDLPHLPPSSEVGDDETLHSGR
jgi:Cdc6-like AAA superfamily ATPase